MGITIGSNIMSLRAQRQLGQTSDRLSSTFERLSSGQRINRASDDAAGLAIASSLDSDRRVFNQGIRNLNDGISALTIAEGALDSLSFIVIRLQELAEQAANGVYGTTQRKSLDQEAQALSDEYFRISKTTEFNGINLLNGSSDGMRLQAGYGLDGGIASDVGGAVGTGSFGGRTSFAAGDGPWSVALGDLNGDGVLDMVTADRMADRTSVFFGNGDGSFRARASYATGDGPVSVTLGDLNGDGVLDIATVNVNTAEGSVLIGNGDGGFRARISFATGSNPSSVTLGDLNGDGMLDMVTADSGNDKASVFIGKGDGSFYARTSYAAGSAPRSVTLGDLNGDGVLDMVTADQGNDRASVFIGKGDGSFHARTSYAAGDGIRSIALGDLNGDGVLDMASADMSADSASVLVAITKSGTAPLLPFSLASIGDARQALPVFQQKLEQLASQRGQIGAFQSRLSVAVNVLNNTSENYAAASGRIMDADIAHESADLVTRQILQQAGSAVLAQANQAPALALRLLT